MEKTLRQRCVIDSKTAYNIAPIVSIPDYPDLLVHHHPSPPTLTSPQ